jgi:hypothetical protein
MLCGLLLLNVRPTSSASLLSVKFIDEIPGKTTCGSEKNGDVAERETTSRAARVSATARAESFAEKDGDHAASA